MLEQAIKKLETEIEQNNNNSYIRVVGDYLLQHLIANPNSAEKIMAEGKTVAKSLDKKNMANIEQLKNLQRSAKALEEELQKEQARARDASPEKVKKLEEQLQQAQAQVEELTAELNKPVTMEAAVIEKVLEEVQQELDALREKQKNGDQKAAAQLKFRITFDVLVKDFDNFLGALGEIKKAAPREYQKYEDAVIQLLDEMAKRV